MDVAAKQLAEINFWRDSPDENPEADSLPVFLGKMSDASLLHGILTEYDALFPAGARVLELGAGQGWAGCLVKRMHPDATVVSTDISSYAVAARGRWERAFGVSLDGAYDCLSTSTKEADSSVDLVFAFSAAHHFLRHDSTLKEMARILKPGGTAIWIHEPVTPKVFHGFAHWRVNRKRPEVPEDVLITSRLRELAGKHGLQFRADYTPTTHGRGRFETTYFLAQSYLRPLTRMLPSTANLLFTKPAA